MGIPNQTVKRLMYGYLRDAYDDVGVFSVDVYTFSRLMRQMAYEGAWQPVLDFLRDALAEQTGIRDYMDGEKVIHGFVAAHLSMIDQFMLHSEYELNKGFADLYLEPFVAQYSDMRYGYVLELKYLKRS
ncbi:MAG: PD-(D/E)XK nuclease domain-containing protein, partial [Candidatus Latescibacteria bacterium]|nr:PD-(D/E)XK nuclease domain-containing protein [Candidatus Latescibacterota bacterium]